MVTNLPNFQTPDKFDAAKGYQLVSFGSDGRLLEVELNELQKIQNHVRAEILRKSIHSGVFEAGAVDGGTGNPGAITLPKALTAHINGYLVEVPAGTVISLPAPPTFGSRDDLVFLEAWFENIAHADDPALIDVRIGEETSRRLAFKWRIRTVAGVDFTKFPDGVGVLYDGLSPSVRTQGANASPVTSTVTGSNVHFAGFFGRGMEYVDDYTSSTLSTTNKQFKDDAGIFVGGRGDQASKDYLKTVDGYVYALPLFRVKRRNSGGYRNDNLHGASVHPEASDRPDGKFANIIDQDDLIDLRHKVSLTGENYDKLLHEDFDKLLRGELNTVAKPALAKERFGLVPAPYEAKATLMPTRKLLEDATEVHLTNLMGDVGDFKHGTDGWYKDTPAAASVSTDKAKYGTNSLLMERTGSNDFVHYVVPEIQTGKLYVLLFDAFYETAVSSTYIEIYAKDSYSGQNTIGDMNNGITTAFVPKHVKFQSTHNSPRLVFGGSATWKLYLDGLRIYEVDQATYDKIGVDAAFTGAELAKKFPYVDSYASVAENLFDKQTAEIHKGISTSTGWTYEEENGAASGFMPVIPTYGYDFGGSESLRFGAWYDSAKNYVSRIEEPMGLNPMLTAPANAYFAKMTLPVSSLDTFYFRRESMSRNYVPYGKWYLPTDYASNQVPGRLADFSGNRQVFSDAQATEKRTAFVDAISSVHPSHIKTTQASTGQWTAGDTLTVSSSDGVVHGLIDTDTAIARILRGNDYGNLATIVLDNVDGLAVNDTITIVKPDGLIRTDVDAVHTVNDIDTATNEITITQSQAWYSIEEGDFVVESTASSSSPVVTAPGIAGTWTNLGEKGATYTISTAPTVTTDPIKVEYAVSYPEGKGLQTVPSEVLGATVNGVPYEKSNTLKLRETFEGIGLDTGPHFAYLPGTGASGLTLRAPGDADWHQFRDPGAYTYADISVLGDGELARDDFNGSGYMAQQLFSFDVVGAVERQYGAIPADDLAGKVAWVGANVTKLVANWHGYGTSPAGFKATFKYWYGGGWNTAGTTTSSSVAQLVDITTGNGVSGIVEADGFVHFLAHSEPSDGVGHAYLYTDYMNLEIEVNVAETGYDVFVPTERRAVKVNDASLFQPGENMLPPFTEWALHDNAEATGAYELDLNAVATFESSTVSIPVLPNTTYVFKQAKTSSTNSVNFWEYDTVNGYIGGYSTVDDTPKVITTQATAARLEIELTNTTTGAFKFVKPMLTPGDKARAFVPYTKPAPKRKRVLDFVGKTARYAFDNPHRMATRTASSQSPAPTIGVGYAESTNQSSYDAIRKVDGTLYEASTSTAGGFGQHLFEFDLAHLGLSLAELKKAVKTLTVKWTGYGVGDNAGVLTYGATMLWWRTDSGAWESRATDTASTPTTLTVGDNGNASAFYLNKASNQKLYVLMRSTYPAGAASNARTFTDHISLEVELADGVDILKKNVIKVRPQNKELKLQYPAYSPATGRRDAIELFYKTAPYQGTDVRREGTIVALGDPYKVNGSTGKVAPVTYGGSQYRLRNAELAFLPLLDFEEYAYISEVSHPAYRVKREDTLGGYVRTGFAVGRAVTFSDTVATPTRTIAQRVFLDGTNSILAIEQGKAGEIVALPYLVESEGKLFLFVSTAELDASGQAYHQFFATDIFEVTGRPLIKGQ